MPRDGSATRLRILDTAEEMVLQQGFTGTTVDAVIARAGVAKGAFFHHFASKSDLARALLERYADRDVAWLDAHVLRARRLVRDPLQRLLVLMGLIEEEARNLNAERGCLFASFLYELQLIDDVTSPVVRRAMLHWRTVLRGMLDEVVAERTPRIDVDLDDLADGLMVLFEGSFVLARAVGEADTVARQLIQHRAYLELLFDAVPGGGQDAPAEASTAA